MKKALFTSIICLACTVAFSQDFPKMWAKGKEKTVDGHKILKEEGSGSPFIAWKTKEEFKTEMLNRSKKEMWTADSLAKINNWIDEKVKGGKLYLKVVRTTIEAANTKHFTAVFFDTDGKEIYRQKFDPSVATYEVIGTNTFWNNISSILIPVEVQPTFKVVIIDDLSDEKTNHTFQIKS